MELYNITTFDCSKVITKHYSTSFTLGIKTLHKQLHRPIYGIYGFVRYADEIVDTFHGFDKKELLQSFREDTFKAIKNKISLNPVLNSFQLVVNQYGIEHELIEAFLDSMEMDLYNKNYQREDYGKYIYGSAEVVGLMCLRVFLDGDNEQYNQLKGFARKLGSAFQKVNFLRDINSDFTERGRIYFPGVDFTRFNAEQKRLIEEDIKADFEEALKGIRKLPPPAKMGVYLAYIYYLTLFEKIKKMPVGKVLSERIRVPDNIKFALLLKTYFRTSFNSI